MPRTVLVAPAFFKRIWIKREPHKHCSSSFYLGPQPNLLQSSIYLCDFFTNIRFFCNAIGSRPNNAHNQHHSCLEMSKFVTSTGPLVCRQVKHNVLRTSLQFSLPFPVPPFPKQFRSTSKRSCRAQSPSIRTPSPSFFATEVHTERNSVPGPSKPVPAKFFDAPELPGTPSDGALFWKPIVQPCISETVQVGDPFKDETEPAGRFIEVSKDKPTHALYWNRRHPIYSFLQEQRTIFDAGASTSPSSSTTTTPMPSLLSNA
ncbi:uncharacterized protein C8R40DRAFT_1170582 [Lentinula edodes]|uniref:uncharacterized protein n=1 Tax=Lentinula edodes TaxID=5353 RepID=UPI001E8CF41E|nr:uncharacterized protein C8R40DRAFT_1170571 [Lentinula edodes]XP_046086585.1 uncharacterized protein C8R40DRAFT_1170576 [Lentinula edodes]XP_046086591.1 uncharacterized protein C8R40DRAFT_1170582 [Lentinula edodes]KAH7875487.1 hypothetical protein C8R40DRAFT_1170571 [Lentinula edodes]KAH7875491.1 hypothetical protein C8R40DRAFT_1170576 [Lentinula edodes]KAH7875497.1 hypothetical protein C8R40DRAFT_1170582 [Lentinula edodes]